MLSLEILIPTILLINLIVALVTIFREERDISTTWAWLLVLVLLPVVGFVFYLFAGRKISKKTDFRYSSPRAVRNSAIGGLPKKS